MCYLFTCQAYSNRILCWLVNCSPVMCTLSSCQELPTMFTMGCLLTDQSEAKLLFQDRQEFMCKCIFFEGSHNNVCNNISFQNGYEIADSISDEIVSFMKLLTTSRNFNNQPFWFDKIVTVNQAATKLLIYFLELWTKKIPYDCWIHNVNPLFKCGHTTQYQYIYIR